MIEPDFYELLIRNFKGSTDAVGCGFTAEYPDKSVKHTCKRKTVISGRDIIKEFLKENILSPIVTVKVPVASLGMFIVNVGVLSEVLFSSADGANGSTSGVICFCRDFIACNLIFVIYLGASMICNLKSKSDFNSFDRTNIHQNSCQISI